MTRPRRWFLFASRLGLLLLLPVVAGCGSGQGTVSGRVLYNGKPLPGGWITFRPVDSRQNSVPALIDPNGNYEAKLPAGDVLISVDNRELEPVPAAPAPGLPPGVRLPPAEAPKGEAKDAATRPAGTYVPILEKYYNVETSGLRYTVKKGPQPYDIELK